MEIVDNKMSSPRPTISIKKLEYPSEIREELERLIQSKAAEIVKKPAIRRLIGTKSCSVCQGVPEYEVIYPLGDASKIERYCSDCFNKREETDSKYIDPNDYFVMAPKD
jgi:hypothetical protein